jgi:predicted dehydrogenase
MSDRSILILGYGSIGSRHARNLTAVQAGEILVFDPSVEARDRAAGEVGARTFDVLDAALSEAPQIVFVTTPPGLLVPSATKAAEAGCHLFIEKPLSTTADGLDDLQAIAQSKGLVTMAGCNMRFHHGPSTVKRLLSENAIGRVTSAMFDAGYYMPDWNPDRDYRTRYSAHKGQGGGVLLDGIHELDIARWLLGDPEAVFCDGGHLSGLDIDVEDSINVVMMFGEGHTAMIHLDYIQRSYARSCKVIGTEGTIEWDIRKGVRHYSAETETWQSHDPEPEYDINDMYVAELAHFLECVEKGCPTVMDVEEGAKLVKIAAAVRTSMGTGLKVRL